MSPKPATTDPRIKLILEKVLQLAACGKERDAPPAGQDVLDAILHKLALIEEKLEAAPQLGHDQLLGILKRMEDGICIVNAEHEIEYINPAAEREFGPVQGRKCHAYFHNRTEPCPHCDNDEVLAGRTLHWEKHSAETRKTYEIFATPYRYPDGRISKLEICHDITAHKRIERQLRAANEILEGIFSTVHIQIAYLDPDFNFIRVNPAYAAAAGHAPEYFLGKNHFHLYPHAENEAIFRRTVETGDPYSAYAKPFEYPDHPERGVTFLDWHLYPTRDANGKTTGLLLSLIDVTAHRRAEQAARESERKYRTLLNNLHQGVFLKGRDLVYVSCNRRFAHQLDITPEEIVGKTDYDFFPASLAEEHRQSDLRIMRTGMAEETEAPYRCKDGMERVMHTVKVPFMDDNGKVIGVLGIFWDVTNRKRVAEELRMHRENLEQLVRARTQELAQANAALRREIAERKQTEQALIASEHMLRDQAERLAAADRRKDEFLAVLAHELRNPLAPIHHAAELLKRLDPQQATPAWAVGVIARQTEHMTRLVDDLLDIGRIARGRIQLHKETLRLQDAISRAVEAARPIIEARQHELSVEQPPTPIWLDGDLVRLAQIVGNLLNNAAKYTPKGGHIRLTAEREGDAAVIRVQDTGIGIPPELLPHIFEPFVQAEHTLDRTSGGLGLGLSLVRALTEMHCGSVSAKNMDSGTGSEFTVRLPIAAEAPDEADRSCAATESPAPATRCVLVVDDNVDVAKSFTMLLDILGHEVHTVHDGPAALEAVRRVRPEIVFLDIGLPGMSGYEVAQHLREEHGDTVQLVALTGYGQEQDRLRAEQAGFDLHLLKPVAIDALEAVLAADPPRQSQAG